MQLIPLKFLRLRKFLGGRGTVAQLTSTSRVTRLFQFYVSFRTDAGSVLPYVCDKRGYPPVDVVRLSRSLNRRCPGLYCVFYGNLVCRSVSHGRRREKKFFFIFFWAYEWVWDAESRWLYCTSLWVECTWDVASCSGANSVVSLACICFLLVCQFVPDHAKIVRFVALPGQLTSLLRISHFRKCSISSVTSKPWNSISAQYIKYFFLPFDLSCDL